MLVFVLLCVFGAASAGIVNHGVDDLGHGQATSYQHVNIESYHPVPVYIKKEDAQYLEHPVSQGHISTSVEVQHGQHYSHEQGALSAGHQDTTEAGHNTLHVAPVQEEQGASGHYDGGAEYESQGGQVSQGYEYEGHQDAANYGQETAGGGGYGHQNSALAFEHSSIGDQGVLHYH